MIELPDEAFTGRRAGTEMAGQPGAVRLDDEDDEDDEDFNDVQGVESDESDEGVAGATADRKIRREAQSGGARRKR